MNSLDTKHAKALSNLVMALSSYELAKSVVGLSNSPVYHFQYSSICDAVNGISKDSEELENISRKIRCFLMDYMSKASDGVYRINSDTTSINKPHSPTLSDRTYIHVPNTVIAGNKPLSVGYRLSCVTLSESAGWQLPLEMSLVGVEQTATECLLQQLKELFEDSNLPFGKATMVIQRADRAYGNAHYLAPSHAYANLVNITRLRKGQKVFVRNIRTQTGGRNAIYDANPYYLTSKSETKSYKYKGEVKEKYLRSIFDLTPTQQVSREGKTKKGRAVITEIRLYQDLLLRSKKGNIMSDKPINLACISTKDKLTGELLFEQEQFIAACGQPKDRLSPQAIFEEYMDRYGIEPLFRFSKQNLFLQSYQTPDKQHLENWFLVVQLAIWLLHMVAQEAKHACQKWQKYSPKEQLEVGSKLSMTQARKAAQSLLITFDKKPFLPKKSQKGKGRQKEQKQVQRTRYQVFKKKAKTPT